MAKIKNAKPKQSGGGYERLVGNKPLAELLTKAQSTVITNGTELEKIIKEKKAPNNIDDLNKFIDECDKGLIQDGTYLCTKKAIKQSKYKMQGNEPDFIVYIVNKNTGNFCYIVELKDGDAFDTKKSHAEKEMLQTFLNHLAPQIPFRTKFYVCSFNQSDPEKIVTGFKNAFTINEVLTGEDFCDILGINYQDIVTKRAEDAKENFLYVVEKMGELKEVLDYVVNAERKHIQETEFYGQEDSE